MEKNNGKRKALVIATIVCVSLLVGILGSYAFFISTGGNNTPEELSVQTGNMALTFSDGSSSFQGALEFGGSATKTFTIENTGSIEAKGRMKWNNLVNTYLEGSLTYTLSYSETEDGEYTPIIENKNVPRSTTETAKTLAPELVIPVGQTYYYKLVITLNYLTDIDQTTDLNAMLTTEFSLEEANGIDTDFLEGSERTLAVLNVKTKEGAPNFAESATTDETSDGLYAMADDYGTSYYYRGAVTNNYVKFAGFWWRIIRINGDGSLRIIYDGTKAYTNGTAHYSRLALENVAWNTTNYNDAKYVGYMYGGANGTASTSKEQAQTNETDTNIKTKLEEWYKTNIVEKGLDQYVSDEIFCNDRSTPGKDATNWSSDKGLGYGTNETAYGARARLINGDTWAPRPTTTPSFVCPNKNDAFTKNDTVKGNGALSQKVGLITADEISAAGGTAGTGNSNYYLYKGSWYWSLSPDYFSGAYAHVFIVSTSGYLSNEKSNSSADGFAPVINLSAEYVSTLKGTGVIGDEYEAK